MGQPRSSTMRTLRPAPHLLAFYDGRIAGVRAWSAAPNWLDDGAFALGSCCYAVVDGSDALMFDTHMSTEHAAAIRRTLEQQGARAIRVVLSHWHADHIAGNAVFQDCEILANRLTARLLVEHQDALEGGDPPIRPLVHPTTLFDGSLRLDVGTVPVELHQMDVHSQDGTVMLLPQSRLLLAGDTLEDPITYVTEPDRLERHLADLDRMAGWDLGRILPNHGAEDVIAAGGYPPALIAATRRYVEALLGMAEGAAPRDLREIIGADLAAGTLQYFAAYEDVHRRNVEQVLSRRLVEEVGLEPTKA